MNASPAPIFAQLDSYSLTKHSIVAWNRILDQEYHELDADIRDKIEDIIMALEYIEGWEPSDAEMVASFGTQWHDGCR